MTYQQKRLSDLSDIGTPGPLPALFNGVGEESLADLFWAPDWFGEDGEPYVGTGFFVVVPPAPPAPPPERVISALAFMQRLTPAERIGIRTLAKTDVAVEDYLDLLSKATLVDLDHPDTINGLAFLVSKGRLTAERAAEIRAGDQP